MKKKVIGSHLAHFTSSSGEKSICGLVGVSGIAWRRHPVSSSTTRSPSERMSPREMLSSWSGSTWNIRSTRPVVATEKGNKDKCLENIA